MSRPNTPSIKRKIEIPLKFSSNASLTTSRHSITGGALKSPLTAPAVSSSSIAKLLNESTSKASTEHVKREYTRQKSLTDSLSDSIKPKPLHQTSSTKSLGSTPNSGSTKSLQTKSEKNLTELINSAKPCVHKTQVKKETQNSNISTSASKKHETKTTETAHHHHKLYVISIKPGSKNLNKHELATGYGFNEEQIAVFEETFSILDKDANGVITLQEIREVMTSLGYATSDENIRQRIKAIDSDNSGTVDFQEFICMMSTFRKVKTTAELDQELKDVFKLFDKNCDGFIDKYELKDVLQRLGENISEDEVFEMIKEADLDGDSKVSFSEFRSILSENKPTIK